MGGLTINPSASATGLHETDLRGPAWWALDLSPLWGFPDLRGDNVVIPHADGRRAYRRRIDQTTVSIPLVIVGNVDRTGATHANAFQGLWTNLTWLQENVHEPPPTGATRVARLTLPSGQTITADVQCRLTLGAQTSATLRAVLDVTIPSGGFR